jgi:cytochrome c oxidase subunit 2
LAAVAAAFLAVTLAGCGDKTGPDNKQSALRPAGPYSTKILDLTRPFFWIAVVIGIGVIAATIYVALRFRVKPGEERAPKQTHGNTVLEVSWTIIPAIILAVMAVPTIATVFSLAQKPKGPDVVHIQVSARQWWWQFTYTDPGNGVVTANEMHIPVGVPVSLSLVGPPACTGKNCYNNGVIHSFWIPALNGKKDVVPGRDQFLKLQADRPGTFLGQCAEYCGLSHADMRMRVIAQPMDAYKAWVAQQLQPLSKDQLAQFDKFSQQWGCLACHSVEPKTPGAVAPNLTHLADRCKFAGDIYTTDQENLQKWIHNAPSRKPMGNLTQHMPNFSATAGTDGQTMTMDQAAEIATWLLHNTGTGPVPPAECSQ